MIWSLLPANSQMNPEPTLVEPASPELSQPTPQGWAGVEMWLEAHIWLLVLVVVAGSLLVRVLTALSTVLNPDEAMHVLRCCEPTLYAVYRADLAGPDPSFLHVLLFPLCKWLASDFVLRLPSILAGTLTVFVGYKWLHELFDRTTGLIGMILLAFAPAVVYLSAEVRAYALVMCFSVCALYCLEAGVRRRSVVLMLFFGLAQCLALVSQYSAIIVLFIAGCYSLYLVLRGRVRGRVFWTWLVAEVVTVGLLVFQYVTHLARLHGSQAEAAVKTGFLNWAYFNPARDTVFGFFVSRTVAAFGFLFTSPIIGYAALVLFLAGVVLLVVRGVPVNGSRGRRELGLLLIGPWLVAAVGGLLALYPFADTRHISLLVVFAVAGIAFLVRQIVGRRPMLVMLAALVLMPLWNVTRYVYAAGWHISPADTRRSHIVQAVGYAREVMPDGGFIFSDLESHYVFRRYLYQGHPGKQRAAPAGFYETERDGYRMVTLDYWKVSADSFGNEFHRMAEAYGLEPGTRVVVVTSGWGPNLASDLRQRLNITYPELRTFGGLKAVFVVPVGSEVMTASLKDRVERTSRALDSLAVVAASHAGRQSEAVFWPTYYLTDSTRRIASRLTDQVLSYTELCHMASGGTCELNRYLPTLAFWDFNTRERVPEFLGYMDDGESYLSAGYRFTLVGVDPDTVAGVYLIESVIGRKLDSLAKVVKVQAGSKFQAVLWPTDYLTDSTHYLTDCLSDRLMSYAELYQKLTSGELGFGEYLPALAFWVFNTAERHPEFMAYMNDGEHYISAGYRFTSVLIDPDTVVGVYVIEPLPLSQ